MVFVREEQDGKGRNLRWYESFKGELSKTRLPQKDDMGRLGYRTLGRAGTTNMTTATIPDRDGMGFRAIRRCLCSSLRSTAARCHRSIDILDPERLAPIVKSEVTSHLSGIFHVTESNICLAFSATVFVRGEQEGSALAWTCIFCLSFPWTSATMLPQSA